MKLTEVLGRRGRDPLPPPGALLQRAEPDGERRRARSEPPGHAGGWRQMSSP